MFQYSHHGKTLAEYALIGFLALLISIPALTLLGERISLLYSESQPIAKAQPLFNLLSGNGGGGTGSTANAGQDAGGSASDAVFYDLENYSADYNAAYSRAIAASSANGVREAYEEGGFSGATGALASSLEELTEQLVADGEMTEAEAAIFRQLSQQGHKIAGIQGSIEEAISGASRNAAGNYDGATATHNGQTVDLMQLSLQIEWYWTPPENWREEVKNGTLDETQLGPDLQQFVNLYRQGQQTGVMQRHPELGDYLHSLSSTVVYASDYVGSIVSNGFDLPPAGEVEQAVARHEVKGTPAMEIVSDDSHQASTEICGIGDGSDTGTSCR